MAGVTSDIVFAGRMHAKWIKFDVRYLLGQDAAAQQQVIDETQANGFKVLLNVTGDPFEFSGTDRATYIAAYAAYVGALSANGADGIEVWREMNGRMTAQEYVQLLAYAYQAIKTARPDTLVISGALKAVANAENPDDNTGTYYTRLAEAGAAQFADCIGTQYVRGRSRPPAPAAIRAATARSTTCPRPAMDRARRQAVCCRCVIRASVISCRRVTRRCRTITPGRKTSPPRSRRSGPPTRSAWAKKARRPGW